MTVSTTRREHDQVELPGDDLDLTTDVRAFVPRSPGDGDSSLSFRPLGTTPLDYLAPSDQPGSLGRLGQFEVIEVLGRGGMGLVLKAHDAVLQRPVAIKVLDPSLTRHETSRERFCREARAGAAVAHENVIPIHQVELEEGSPLPFIVMQLVSGETLQARLEREGALPVKEILRIGVQVAAGLAAAHAQGLIHRDIKPDNILLEEGTGRVKLTDFGLALAVEDVRLTQTGMVAGTPLYMAPEQAKGEPIDHRADLFSFGSVLYAMAAGRPPFEGGSPYMVLCEITQEPPRPIREINPEIPPDLAAVIDRLHAKDPAQRYQSAAEVAEALGRQLALLTPPSEVPVAIVPVTPSTPARPRRRGRNWVRATVIGAILLAGLITGGILLKVMEAVSTAGGAARAVALSPDGKELAAAHDDGSVRFRDPEGSRISLTLNAHGGVVQALAYTADGRFLATAGDDGTVKLWDAATKKEVHAWPAGGSVRSLTFSPDGRRLVLGHADGSVVSLDVP